MTSECLPLRKLPLELIQKILLYLDIDSFYSATLACRTWRHCALAHYILRKQLESTPMRKSIPSDLSPSDLRLLFNDVSRTHLLGLRVGDCQKVCSPRSHYTSNIPVWSHHGILWAEMQDLDIKIASPSGIIRLKLNPSIFPRPEEVSKARQWFNTGGQVARYQIALSANLDLVAVALGSLLHIYPVGLGASSQQHAECSLQGNSPKWAQSIEFADSDTLVRCEISRGGETSVQYRGFGSASDRATMNGLQYWMTALGNVYLASEAIPRAEWSGLHSIRLILPTGSRAERLSQSCDHTTSFVAVVQRRSHTSYGLCTQSREGNAVISWEVACQSDPANELIFLMDDPRWNPARLPLGKCHKPILAISDDGRLLAIVEQPSNTKSGALFICPLLMHETTGTIIPANIGKRWPLRLDILDHNIISIRLTRHNSWGHKGSRELYTVEAQSYGFNFRWSLFAS